jgi:hypothetical protein
MRTTLPCLLLVLPSLLAFKTLHTPRYEPRAWPGTAVDFYINTSRLPAGSVAHRELERAVTSWDADTIPGSAMRLAHGDTSTIGVHNHDGYNGMAEGPVGGECGQPYAEAEIRFRTFRPTELVETDILFNWNCSWGDTPYFDYNDEGLQKDRLHIKQIGLHEVGHALGLDHYEGDVERVAVCDEYGCIWPIDSYDGFATTMNRVIDGGSVSGHAAYRVPRYFPGEDDREGLRSLYPDAGNEGSDIAVSAYTDPDVPTLLSAYDWQHREVTPQYRTRPSPHHDLLHRAVLEGKAYGSLPTDLSTNVWATPLIMYRGAKLCVDISALNLGDHTEHSVSWRARLLDDPAATTGIVVATGSQTLEVDQPDEGKTCFILPTDLSPGRYWVDVEYDYDNRIAEVREGNNRTWYHREISILSTQLRDLRFWF